LERMERKGGGCEWKEKRGLRERVFEAWASWQEWGRRPRKGKERRRRRLGGGKERWRSERKEENWT